MSGLGGFADEWKRAIKIKVGRLRLKVLPLERILVSKQAADRPKDRRVIPVLQNTLRTLKTKANRRTKFQMKKENGGYSNSTVRPRAKKWSQRRVTGRP